MCWAPNTLFQAHIPVPQFSLLIPFPKIQSHIPVEISRVFTDTIYITLLTYHREGSLNGALDPEGRNMLAAEMSGS